MWDEVLKWLYVHKSLKLYNENKTHHNACNSCATSSMIKHEGFHIRFFLKIFVFKRIGHSTKSLHVWWLLMIHATSTNNINVNICEISYHWSRRWHPLKLPHYHLMKSWIAIEVGFVFLL